MKKYKDFETMVNDIESTYNWWDKFIMLPKMNWLRWTIYNLPDVPRDTYLNIKWFIQRGKRGYADCDVWNFDYYLSDVIVNALKELKNDEMPSVDSKHLDDIIFAFEVERNIIDSEFLYTTPKNRNRNTQVAKNCRIHLMTEIECERYNKGWKLFKQHFKRLWD